MSTNRIHSAAVVLVALGTACNDRVAHAERSAESIGADAMLYPVTVHVPRSLFAIEGTVLDLNGRPTEVRCATCHAGMQPPPALPDAAAGARGPHVGLRFAHGANACASCHDPSRYDRLRLADGTSIAMAEVMRLCTQCHGTQARTWAHGAHGGMRGYWDLRRGPRDRNNCVDCHDPHAPRFPVFRPLPPPSDAPRTLDPREGPHG